MKNKQIFDKYHQIFLTDKQKSTKIIKKKIQFVNTMYNCVSFYLHLLYNYYGENMKDKSPVIMQISTMEDIKKLKESKDVKYINLDITNPNLEVIYYLIDNGQNYLYADMIDKKNGYIYVSYKIFKEASLNILDIINNIPINLDELEIARYLYISIGKKIGYDINILPDKNETFNFYNINTINNIWGSIHNLKGTNVSFTKLYLYLCRIMNIDCQLITTSKSGYLKNMLTINNSKIITDITQDIPYIQSGFKTKNFIGYNDNELLDKKINYIKDSYSEQKIEESLKTLDYDHESIIKEILSKTQKIIGASEIKPIELGIIYDIIFQKYCPNYDISINNLFINKKNKEHFILISYDNKYYSYNYTRESFVELSYDEILNNIETKKIGIYLNERIPAINIKKEKAI